MKKSITVFFITAANYVSAQNLQPFQYNKERVEKFLKNSNIQQLVASNNRLDQPEATDTAKYVTNTPGSKIYALPQDGMLCLKPDSAYAGRLPVKYHGNRSGLLMIQKGKLPAPIALENLEPSKLQMPNAYKGNAIVFEKVN